MTTYDATTGMIPDLVVGDIVNIPYSGAVKSFVLKPGIYKLEVWGAQGGYRSSSTYGGKGGYACGTIRIVEEKTVFAYAGGAGNTGGTVGGFNGGGRRYSYSGGGGASDFRIGTDSLFARILVAGGGGSDGASSKGGGVGGGVQGGSNSGGGYGTNNGPGKETFSGSSTSTTATSQSTSTTTSTAIKGGFGFGGNGCCASSGYGGAGGGGWYGGSGTYPDSSGDDDKAGCGGSGYVWTAETASQYPDGCLLDASMYLTEAQTIAGSATFTSPTGTSETGHTDNGHCRVTMVEAIPQHTVTFIAGDEVVETQSVYDGGYATPPAISGKYGSWDFDFTTPITQDITIYAKLAIYTVTFKAFQTIVGTQEVEWGETAIPIEPPAGYFGWNFDFTTPITQDITIYATSAMGELMFRIWDGDPAERFTYKDMNRVEFNANFIAREIGIAEVAFSEVTRSSQFDYDQANKLEQFIKDIGTACELDFTMDTSWNYNRIVSYVDFERWESNLFMCYQALGGIGERIPADRNLVVVSATLFASSWTGAGPFTQDVAVPVLGSDQDAVVFVHHSADLWQRVAEYKARLVPRIISTGRVRVLALSLRPEVNLPIRIQIGGFDEMEIVTLLASGWSLDGDGCWRQTVQVQKEGMDAIVGVQDGMTVEQVEQFTNGAIHPCDVSGKAVTFRAMYLKPTVDLPVGVAYNSDNTGATS